MIFVSVNFSREVIVERHDVFYFYSTTRQIVIVTFILHEKHVLRKYSKCIIQTRILRIEYYTIHDVCVSKMLYHNRITWPIVGRFFQTWSYILMSKRVNINFVHIIREWLMDIFLNVFKPMTNAYTVLHIINGSPTRFFIIILPLDRTERDMSVAVVSSL